MRDEASERAQPGAVGQRWCDGRGDTHEGFGAARSSFAPVPLPALACLALRGVCLTPGMGPLPPVWASQNMNGLFLPG